MDNCLKKPNEIWMRTARPGIYKSLIWPLCLRRPCLKGVPTFIDCYVKVFFSKVCIWALFLLLLISSSWNSNQSDQIWNNLMIRRQSDQFFSKHKICSFCKSNNEQKRDQCRRSIIRCIKIFSHSRINNAGPNLVICIHGLTKIRVTQNIIQNLVTPTNSTNFLSLICLVSNLKIINKKSTSIIRLDLGSGNFVIHTSEE